MTEVVNDVVASMSVKEEAVERQNGELLAATHSATISIEPQVHARHIAGTMPTRAKRGARSEPSAFKSNQEPTPTSPTSHASSRPSGSTRHGSFSNGSTSNSDNGSSAAVDVHSEPSAVSSSLPESPVYSSSTNGATPATNGRKKPPKWQVLSSERLGLYASPHSTFPAEMPTDDTQAIGTSPKFLPPSNESGLLRRIPQSQDELLQEMEELELKNPSASLQVRLCRLSCQVCRADSGVRQMLWMWLTVLLGSNTAPDNNSIALCRHSGRL